MARALGNLRLYQLTKKQIKAANNMNWHGARSSAVIESYKTYQETYFRMSKQLRQAGVKMSLGHRQGDFIPGEVAHYDTRSNVMSLGQYIRYSRRFADLSAEQIALKQYNLIPTEVAETLQKSLRENGLGEYSLELIRARQLPDEVWLKMQEIALSKDSTINATFFGS